MTLFSGDAFHRRTTNDERRGWGSTHSSFVVRRSSLVLRHRLDGVIGWPSAPVTIQHAERGLLMQLIALILPRHCVVQLPQEHRANRGVALASDLERSHDPIGLILVRNVITEAVAGRVVL